MDLDHLSYSSITMFLDCPEAWRRKYVVKEHTIATPALVVGSAFHGAIEAAVKTGEVQNLPQFWNESWAKATEQPIDWGTDTPESFYNDGLRMLGHPTILNAITGIKPRSPEDIERKVELWVPGVPLPIIGYIDIILADGTPADFKTSSKSWAEDKASGSLQTLFYLAAMNQAAMDVNWKFKHLVFVKTKEPKFQMLEHQHKPSELFFLFELIRRVWTSIEKEVFPINPTGWRCNPIYCDFYCNCRGKYG